jgi:CRP/FNR family cyclic AMP-dependent transcriptional regulator
MADVIETLRRVPLFAGMTDKELKRLAANMTERTFPEGKAVTTQGQSGVGFFVIEDGEATVSRDGETIRDLGPGDYFGEIALIDNGPRSATIVAGSELHCRGMTAMAFRPLVQTHPEIAWPLIEALVGRLRETEQRPG